MRRRRALAATVVAAGLALAGCSDGDPCADGDVESLGALVPQPVADELTRSGGCGDVALWASDEAGSLAVEVRVDLRDRPATATTTVQAVLPDDDVEVTVLHGRDLPANLCTDDPDPSADPTATSPGAQGRVEVVVDPTAAGEGCPGAVRATFRIDGLEAEDGTTFGPIAGTARAVGCERG